MAKKSAITDDMLLEDAATGPTSEQLQQIMELVQQQLRLEAAVADAEEKLNTLNQQLRKVSDEELPTAMKAASLESFTTKDGQTIKSKKDMSVSLSAGKKVVAINWLRTIGKESLIRSTITVDVPKGTSPKLVEKLKAVISKTQLPMVVGEDVNTGSFKALLKEKLEEGAKIDLQSLGAYEYTRAKIEQPKAPKK